MERTRDEWEAFAAEHDCCLEPVLDLDEALDSELVRAREMVVELDQPGAAAPVRQLGLPVKLVAHARRACARPGPALGEHTDEVLRGGRLLRRGDRGARRRRARSPGPAAGRPGVVPGRDRDARDGLLKMSELAERSGVSAGTIKHYLREGLLPRAGRARRATWPTTRPTSSSASG